MQLRTGVRSFCVLSYLASVEFAAKQKSKRSATVRSSDSRYRFESVAEGPENCSIAVLRFVELTRRWRMVSGSSVGTCMHQNWTRRPSVGELILPWHHGAISLALVVVVDALDTSVSD